MKNSLSFPVSRRGFVGNCAAAAIGGASAGLGTRMAWGAPPAFAPPEQPLPLKIGIRAASMKMAGSLDVIKTAAGVPGLTGVELQITAGKENLRDWDVVRRYKKEADRWAIRIPSLAGVWDRGVNIQSPNAADSVRLSLRAAEMLGSGVILLAFFKNNAPDMDDESSFGPVVEMLKATAKDAADAGVILGLENSLSPVGNKKLVDLVDHPAVGVYYDLHNMDYYGHGDQAVPGVRLLGRERICAVHVKNGDKLIEEPGPIDWLAAFEAFGEIGYDGWFIYETGHDSTEDCLADTAKNNAYLQKHIRMPSA